MCQCSCAEQEYREAFQIKGTKCVVSYQTFPGCRDCNYGPGFAISFFDSPKVEWLEGLKIQSIKPDEYGTNSGVGVSVGLFDQEDLRAAARELWKEASIGASENQYASIEEWLHDFGQELIADAVYRYRERTRVRATPGEERTR